MPTRTLTRDRCHVRADYEITPACKRVRLFFFFFGGVFFAWLFFTRSLGGIHRRKKSAPLQGAFFVKLRT